MGILNEPGVKKIGVFRALQLGDMLCSVPAIRSIKKALPDAELILIGLPWAKDFVRRYSDYFSGFIPFPGYPGLPEQDWNSEHFAEFIRNISNEKFDLIIQMQGDGSIVNPMVELMNAKYTAGFYKENDYCPDPELFLQYPNELPEIHRHLELIKFLGAHNWQTDLEFPIKPSEHVKTLKMIRGYNLIENEFVCMHCGARDERKRWSAKNFSEIADYISEKGFQIVLTGTESEKKMVADVEKKMKSRAINLTGKTDLATLAALLKNARMLFSNDTGLSHLAACVKTPSVVVFLYSDPVRWAPLNKSLHEIILPEDSENLEMIKTKINKILGKNFRTEQSLEVQTTKLKTKSKKQGI